MGDAHRAFPVPAMGLWFKPGHGRAGRPSSQGCAARERVLPPRALPKPGQDPRLQGRPCPKDEAQTAQERDAAWLHEAAARGPPVSLVVSSDVRSLGGAVGGGEREAWRAGPGSRGRRSCLRPRQPWGPCGWRLLPRLSRHNGEGTSPGSGPHVTSGILPPILPLPWRRAWARPQV